MKLAEVLVGSKIWGNLQLVEVVVGRIILKEEAGRSNK